VADPDEWDQESGQLGGEDTLDDRGVTDPLDEGVSPAERPWIGDGWGVTAREEATGESWDGRLARELPDRTGDDEGDLLGDSSDTDGELWDDEVGEARAGRLLGRDEGGADADEELWASDVGVDGAGASAEEAAVHVVGDRDDDAP
jgi:hypothetical protein